MSRWGPWTEAQGREGGFRGGADEGEGGGLEQKPKGGEDVSEGGGRLRRRPSVAFVVIVVIVVVVVVSFAPERGINNSFHPICL